MQFLIQVAFATMACLFLLYKSASSDEVIFNVFMAMIHDQFFTICEFQIIERQLGSAAARGNISLVTKLLDENKEININWIDTQVYNDCGWSASNTTALLRATKCNRNIEIIRLLVSAGANISLRDSLHCTPLLWAARNGNSVVVSYLAIDNTDNVNNRIQVYNETVFIALLPAKRIEILERLIDREFTTSNSADANGTTFLMYAAMSDYLDGISMLVRKGANCSAKNNDGKTALMFANNTYNFSQVILEIKKCATWEVTNRPGLQLGNAASANDIAKVKNLLADNSTRLDIINWCDQERTEYHWGSSIYLYRPTALMRAIAKHGNLTMISLLIDAGANVNGVANGAQTPLVIATEVRSIRVVKHLINRGANVNWPEGYGCPAPLKTAISNSYQGDIVQLLIDNGANLSNPECLEVVRYSRGDVVKLLLASGANRSRCQHLFCLFTSTTPTITATTAVVPLTTLRPITYAITTATTTRVPTREVNLHRQFSDAVVHGNLSLIEEMLSKNGFKQPYPIDVNWVDTQIFTECGNLTFYESTVLLKALKCRRPSSIISTLIEAGANINYSPYEYPGMTPLMVAASCNDIAMVKFLLDNGAGVRWYNSKNESVLTLAASQGHIDVMSLLINRRTISQSSRPAALHAAAMNGKTEAVRLILDRFPETINKKNSISGATALILAARNGYNETTKLLLDYGADINASDYKESTALHAAAVGFDKSDFFKTLLAMSGFVTLEPMMLWAIKNGEIRALNTLLENGVSSNLTDEYGDSILLKACSHGKLEIARLLIDNGADVNARARNGTTILMRIAQIAQNRTDILRLLLDSGAKVNDKAEGVNSGWTAFTYASKIVGNEETLQLLVDRGANISQEALFKAIKDGDMKMAEFLLDNGANVNVADVTYHGWTSLMYCVYSQSVPNVSNVQFLLDRGANINQKDDFGETALYRAVWNGAYLDHAAKLALERSVYSESIIRRVVESAKIVRLLLERGAIINYYLRSNLTSGVILAALHWEGLEIINILLDYGVDVNATYYGNERITALMFAALRGKTEAMSILLDRGADINALNYKNQTALMMAAEYDRYIAVRLLLKRGADRSTCTDMLCF